MLAAMHNAGRRVKLDLFAEPSGNLSATCNLLISVTKARFRLILFYFFGGVLIVEVPVKSKFYLDLPAENFLNLLILS